MKLVSFTSSTVWSSTRRVCVVEPVRPGDETVGHDLAVDEGVVAGTAVERVDAGATEEHVVAFAAADRVVAVAADQDVVADAAVDGERHGPGRDPRCVDDIVAVERRDREPVERRFGTADGDVGSQADDLEVRALTGDDGDVVAVGADDGDVVGLGVADAAARGWWRGRWRSRSHPYRSGR